MATAPILAGDIKLLASKIMDDVPNGGGGPTGNVIPDGASNAIFGDVTERARAGGSVSIRQLHLAVQTDNTSAFMDPSIIVSTPPNDANVSITLAKCDTFALRTAIANTIENYLIQSTEWGGYLLENHVAGQRSIQLFQRPGAPTPAIGRTLVLVSDEGLPGQIIQFVRVTNVDVEVRTFTYSSSGSYTEYKADVVACELTDALRHNFAGSPPSRTFLRDSAKTVVRDTTVADAAQFFGVTPLSALAHVGDSLLRVASVYTQLVPSARTEVVALDQIPAGVRTITLATTPRQVDVAVAAHTQRIKVGQENRGFSFVAMLKPLPAPGTIVISYMALGNWYTIYDDGQGGFEGSGVGQVIYSTGSLSMTFPSMPDAGSSIIVQWGESVGYTNRSNMSLSIREPEYCFMLEEPGVVPGSIGITWESGGALRTATDDGSGLITGDATGFIDYPSNTVLMRTAHLPDPGAVLNIAYTVDNVITENYAGLTPDAGGFITVPFAQQPAAGTVQIEWATARSVSNTSGGQESTTTAIKDAGTGYVIRSVPESYTRPSVGTFIPGAGAVPGPVTPGTPSIRYVPQPYATKKEAGSTATKSQQSGVTDDDKLVVITCVTDDGAGHFIDGMGTVNYVGKSASVKVLEFDRKTEAYKSDYDDAKSFESDMGDGASGSGSARKGAEYGTASVGEQMLAGSTVVASYRVAPAVPQTKTMTYTPGAVTFDLTPYTTDSIVPGSVQFLWMGETCADFEGAVYRGRTGGSPGIASGVVDYSTGQVLMYDYSTGAGGTAISLQSLWTRRQAWTTACIFFRTQAAPIKPTGMVLNLIDTTGANLTAVGDLDGNLTGAHMRGKIEYLTGIAELQFGDYVLDTDLSDAQKLEWWYSADDVGAVQPGKIWRPWPVDPTTLRYNSVSYFYLPIDAEILGLDPVRLPPDGRVPIFRPGSYVVIGHSAKTPAATLSNGQTIDCARTRLSRVRVIGSDSQAIHTGYTADLDAGTVTATDVSGWAQPVVIEHRIEQLDRLRDVQINGDISTVGQLAHEFPAGSTVSSAITAPTLRARVSQFFDQQTWDGLTWKDSLVGNQAPATYNDALAPVELTNAGALTERFALRFTSSTAFECIGEHVGFIGTGSINADFSPINPVGNAPYFTLRAIGWGTGWAAGNVQFLHVVGAMYPFACIRTVQMGPAAGTDYSFELLGRGDVDRPPSIP